MEQLQRRIDALERERTLYRVLVLLGVLAGFVAVGLAVWRSGGATRGGRLASGSIQLLDPAGRTRAELATSPQGQPVLTLYDDQKVPRGSVGLTAEGEPEIAVRAEKTGTVRARMAIDADGQPVLELLDGSGKRRQALSLTGLGDPKFELYYGSGSSAVQFTTSASGPALMLSDPKGTELLRLPSAAGVPGTGSFFPQPAPTGKP